MKKIYYIYFLAFIFLSLTACSESKDETSQVQSKTYTEYKEVADVNMPVTFKLSDFNLSIGGGCTVTLNDTSRLSFTDGESVKNITDINEVVSVTLNLNNPIMQGKELSANILHNNGDITKVYFVVPVAQNNPNALLTSSIPFNTDIFNISSLVSEKAGYEVMRNTDNKIVDIRKTYNKSEIETNGNNIDIIGLYNNHNNIVRLYIGEYNNPDYIQYISVKTVDVMAQYPNANLNFEIKKADYSKVDNGFLFLPGAHYQNSLIIDKIGQIRGFYNNIGISSMGMMTKFMNNRYVTDVKNSFAITDLIGNILIKIPYSFVINSVSVSYFGHHDFILLNSGKYAGMYAILVDKTGENTVEDYIIIIDVNEENKSAALIKEIDLKNYLPYEKYPRLPYTTNTSTNNKVDWFHANSIEHDESDDTLIISGRNQGVIKITLPENNGIIQAGKDDITLKWILTPHIGYTATDSINVLDKLLTPLDRFGNPITNEQVLQGYEAHEDFEWNYGQHTALLRSGNLIMFDNGDGRYNQATDNLIETDGSKKKFSRYVEYKIDENNMTVQQIYSFGKDNPEVYSKIMSKVDTLLNGNFFMFSAWQKYLTSDNIFSTYTEVDKDSNIVFQMEVRQDNLATPLGSPTYRMYHINPFDYVNVDFN